MLRSVWARLTNPRARRPACRPQLEVLEDRCAPATHTWTGASGLDLNWSRPGNWQGNDPPVVGESGPVVLLFPTVASNLKATVDDLAGGPLVVDQIQFTDAGYAIGATAPAASITLQNAPVTAATGSATFAPSLGLTLSGAVTFYAAPGATVTVSGVADGSGGLTKVGPGTLELTGPAANQLTGPTILADGTLRLGKTGGNAVGDLTVGDGTGAVLSAIAEITSADQFPDTSSVVVSGDGLLLVHSGGQEIVRDLLVIGGTVDSDSASGLTVSRDAMACSDLSGQAARINANLTPATGQVMVSDGPGAIDLDFHGILSGAGSMRLGGGGRTLLTRAQTYTGATLVTGGTLALGVADGLPTGTPLFTGVGGYLDLNGFDQTVAALDGLGGYITNTAFTQATFTVNNAADSNFGGAFAGRLNVVKDNTGTLTFNNYYDGDHAYNGTTTVRNGTLRISAYASLPFTTTLAVSAPGVVDLDGNFVAVSGLTGDGVIRSSGSEATLRVIINVPTTFAGTLIGPVNLAKDGPGTLVLTGPNAHSGTTVVVAGRLANGRANALPVAGGVEVRTGAVYDLNGFDQQLNGFSGSGSITNSSTTPATLTVATGPNEFAGSFTGNLGFAKNSPAALALIGDSDYRGPTAVNAGTLFVLGAQPNSPITMAGGATLSGTGTAGPLTVPVGGIVAPGSRPGALVFGLYYGILGSRSASFAGGSTLAIDLGGPQAGLQYDQLNVTGTADLGGANLALNIDPTFPGRTPSGSRFVIVAATAGLTGRFAGLPDGTTFARNVGGATVTFQLTYTATQVLLVNIGQEGPTDLQLSGAIGTPGASEGAAFTLDGWFTDLGVPDVNTVTIDWADGGRDVFNLAAGTTRFSAAHSYQDDLPGFKPYQVTVTVADPAGNTAVLQRYVYIRNVLPVLTSLKATAATAGAPVTLQATFTDPGVLDTFQLTVVWGDGSPTESYSFPAGTSRISVQHGYQRDPLGVVVQLSLGNEPGNEPGHATPATVPVFVGGFIAALYQDVLHRSPDAGGIAFWTNALNHGLLTRQQIAAQFLASRERRGLVVDGLYQQILHRAADPGGRERWVNALLSGASEADVAVRFVTSAEYQGSHPDNNSYALGLYQDLLQRQGGYVSPDEVRSQQTALDQQLLTRAQLAVGFVTSEEAARKTVTDTYGTLLRRPPDPSGMEVFFTAVRRGLVSPAGLQSILLGSDEYFGMVTDP
jgi:autotransporter-associated beta strand protein